MVEGDVVVGGIEGDVGLAGADLLVDRWCGCLIYRGRG